MTQFRRGQIVWAEIPDPRGSNPKLRPVVIITRDDEITQDGDVVVVGVTTKVDTAPKDVSVELPWARNRHPKTGLKEPSVVVCTWQRILPVASIKALAGVVPGRQLLQIQLILDAISST